jgi:tyrosine-protein kinase Etk/Wzc
MATHLIKRTPSPYADASPPSRDDDIDLPALLGTLAANKRLILLGTGVFLLLSLAYLAVVTPTYQANAVVQVESRPAIPPGLSGSAAMQATPAMTPPGATEVQLLTSRRVLGAALDNLNLDLRVQPERLPVVGDFISRRFQSSNPGALAAPWMGMERYGWGGESLKLSQFALPEELLGVPLQLTARQGNRYTLSNAEGGVLLEGQVGTLVESNGMAVRVDELRANPGMRFEVQRLDPTAVIAALKQNITVTEQGRNSGVITLTYAHPDPVRARSVLDEITQAYVQQNVARNSAEAAKRLKFVGEQLPNVRRELAKAQAALNEFQTRTQTLDVGVQNSALLNQSIALDSAIQQLRIRMTDSTGRYTPQHPTYRALQQQINQFQAEKNVLQARIRELPDTQQGLFRLNRDVEVTNQTYANLLDQQQQLKIAQASAVGNARVVDQAAVNLNTPAWPKPLPVLLVGTLLGTVLMVAWVLFRQMLKRGVEDPIDIELLGLPVYASIPYSEKGHQLSLRTGRRRDSRQRLLALSAPTDLAMEALRTLRTSLHFARIKTRNNMLMITAPSPGVGKTFVCANLAVTIAQTGQRVLLIDADMRRGTLHDAMGVDLDNGLSDLIAGRTTVEQAIRPITGMDNLSFIPRGRPPSHPSELLMHENFEALLKRLAQEYDLVLIDTPPVLAVTDAAVIGHHVGTSLMVVRWGLNQQREIALAKQRLEQNGVDVKGAIFNGVQKQGAGQYAYTYYQYLPAPARKAG